jgi:hypothetical protein
VSRFAANHPPIQPLCQILTIIPQLPQPQLTHHQYNISDHRIGQTLVSPPAKPGAYFYELEIK